MSETRLTDEELAELERAFVPVRDMHAERFVSGRLTNRERFEMLVVERFGSLLAELRSMRALLATPWPDTLDRYWAHNGGRPFVTSPNSVGEIGVASCWIKDDVSSDEAIALGAALIAAGRRAKGEAK